MKRRRKPLPRPKTLPEFFEREEQFWQELLASWEGLPEEAFFQPGACGPEWPEVLRRVDQGETYRYIASYYRVSYEAVRHDARAADSEKRSVKLF